MNLAVICIHAKKTALIAREVYLLLSVSLGRDLVGYSTVEALAAVCRVVAR